MPKNKTLKGITLDTSNRVRERFQVFIENVSQEMLEKEKNDSKKEKKDKKVKKGEKKAKKMNVKASFKQVI